MKTNIFLILFLLLVSSCKENKMSHFYLKNNSNYQLEFSILGSTLSYDILKTVTLNPKDSVEIFAINPEILNPKKHIETVDITPSLKNVKINNTKNLKNWKIITDDENNKCYIFSIN